MIAVLQRAKNASVRVDGEVTGRIDAGLVILLGVCNQDSEKDADYLAGKISGLRIFEDEAGKMNLSVKEVGGGALVISQFTLCGDWRKGRRPSFTGAAAPEIAERLYRYFMERLQREEVPVQSGIFGAMMEVQLINNGPVTFVLDSKTV